MPSRRIRAGAVTIEGKILVIWGWRANSTWDWPQEIQIYDPVADSWETVRTPLGNTNFGMAAVNEKVYLIGGLLAIPSPASNSHARMIEYDPLTGTWTRMADMPTARLFLSASVLNGKIYAMGGSDRNAAEPENNVYAIVEAYDPDTDTWETQPSMLTARRSLATVVLNNKIYAIGGLTGSPIAGASRGTIYATVEEFAFLPDAAPQLAIQNAVLLTWKQSSTDYVVESAASLDGVWAEINPSHSQIVDDEIQMTVVPTSESHFFRLTPAP